MSETNTDYLINYLMYRNSRSKMFFKIGVLKNFANFTEKYLYRSLFLTKFLTNFIKLIKLLPVQCYLKTLWTRMYRSKL